MWKCSVGWKGLQSVYFVYTYFYLLPETTTAITRKPWRHKREACDLAMLTHAVIIFRYCIFPSSSYPHENSQRWSWAEALLPLGCSLPFCSPAYGRGAGPNPLEDAGWVIYHSVFLKRSDILCSMNSLMQSLPNTKQINNGQRKKTLRKDFLTVIMTFFWASHSFKRVFIYINSF